MLNQADGGNTRQQQSSNLAVNSSSIPNHTSASDDLNPENTSEESLSRTLSDETIEYETLLSTLDVSGQNILRASNQLTANDILRGPADRSTHTIDLRLHLPLYKIQLLLLTRNLKAAKCEVKLTMNIAREIDSSRTLQLKAQLEYARENYLKAFKLLKASNSQSDVGSSIIINNNIGCIYYQQGNHYTSSIFFQNALSNCSSIWKEKPRKLVIFSQDKSLLIAYNCGLQYLACGKPVLAARFFLKASLVFYNRPLLWLRLAECCLMALEKGLLKCTKRPSQEALVKVLVIGQGKWRHLAFENGSLRNGIMSSNEKEDSTLDNNIKPKFSLSFARQCLCNALHLLGNSKLKAKFSSSTKSFPDDTDGAASKNLGHKISGANDPKCKDTNGSGQINTNGDARAHSSTAHANTLSEYEEMCRKDDQKIKQAVLIDLAYVELELGNPLKALSTASTLLKIPECSKVYAFWGRVYAAEALCLLNRPKEAAEYLSTYLFGDIVALPYNEEDSRQWQVKKIVDPEAPNNGKTAARVSSPDEQPDNLFPSPEEARGTLYVNLAVMHILNGEFEQASRYATQALAIFPRSQEAALLSVYLDLKLAKSREALTKLKRCRVRFLPVTSRSKVAV